jgi:hypothetical protein
MLQYVYTYPFKNAIIKKTTQKVFLIGLVQLSMACPTRLWAQVNVSGKPGLLYIPTARTLEEGTFYGGVSYNPVNYAFRFNPSVDPRLRTRNSENIYYVNLAILPRLELNINLLRPNGYINFADRGVGDRQIDVKYGLLTETKKRPAVALILSMPFGIDNSLITNALVATKTVQLTKAIDAELTIGTGTPYHIGREDVKNKENYNIFSGFRLSNDSKRYLTGPFGGINVRVNKQAGVMAEWDSKHLNVGAYATLFKHWTVQGGLINGDQLTVGTSYAVNLFTPSRRLTKRTSSQQTASTHLAENTASKPQKESRNVLPDYENLTVDSSQHQIFYEQRLYRNSFVGMIKLTKPLSTQSIDKFVPLFQGVPIARYQVGKQASASTLSRQERADWAKAHPFNSRNYKLDFRLQPEFIAQFGFREQVVEAKTNLLLQSQLFLSRGLVLNWGVLFPIANHFDNQALNVRPAPTFLNQFLALDGTSFLSLSAGLFYNDQYGINAQYRHADLTKNWSYGLESGYTGFYFFPENGVYYQPLQHFTLLADVAYRIPRYDITMKLSGGQYMFKDRGARLDIIRQMGNVEIGFFAQKSTNGGTGGFNFAIPIPPGRIVQTKRVRLRTGEEFRWEYGYSRGYNMGKRYQVGYQLDALLRQYHQSYLQNQYRN